MHEFSRISQDQHDAGLRGTSGKFFPSNFSAPAGFNDQRAQKSLCARKHLLMNLISWCELVKFVSQKCLRKTSIQMITLIDLFRL
ncbi:MAG: hypothetical protein DME60_14590 [Verrucomicrobia bacterium]|nr:MAG: hypothetical protein DME60_14590 [Verrucomicrobiota bacterium]